MLNLSGNKYETVEIPKPEPPYIIMDILSRERNISRGIQIISMNGSSDIKIVIKNCRDLSVRESRETVK